MKLISFPARTRPSVWITVTASHDTTGRLASASEHGRMLVSYGYDAAGQRIMRTEAGKAAELMLYDEAGHWLADVDSTGRITRQAVWMGDYLVGLVEGSQLLYVEPDHLGSPRAVIDPTRNVTVWRWRPTDDPFGTALPDEDPDADGTRFVFDLRFPGQRYDAVTGLYYNYYRDYDADAGRYIQVDPIGLAGGINPYVYANASPLRYTDPTGNIPLPVVTAAIGAAAAAIGDAGAQVYGMYRSGWCKSFNWRELGVSAVGGAVAGAGMPVASTAGLGGVAVWGGVSNMGTYVANGGDIGNWKGMTRAGVFGVIGASVGGAVQRITPYGLRGTAADAAMLKRSNNAADVRLNTKLRSLTRGLAGGVTASFPEPRDADANCGCDP